MRSIFVSSTFRDMQAERDLIHLEIMPYLRERAAEHGEHLDFIDLRWGVNTANLEEEAANEKVLQVCLENIDRSKPYMIIFLGDRYGWIPPSHLLENITQQKKYQRKYQEESVTALEIEYGALSGTNPKDCIVCIRDNSSYDTMDENEKKDYCDQDDFQKHKLLELKAELRHQFGENVIYYRPTWDAKNKVFSNFDTLKEQIKDKFIRLFEEDWALKSITSKREKELIQSKLFFQERQLRFAGREQLLNTYESKLLNEQKPILFIKGEAGNGKSSILAMLMERFKKRGFKVIPFASGISAGSSTAEDFIKQAVWQLESWLSLEETLPEYLPNATTGKLEETSIQIWKQYFEMLCHHYHQSQCPPVVFCIDALDQLLPTQALKSMDFIPECIGSKIKVICTSQIDFSINTAIDKDSFSICNLSTLETETQAREVLEGILAYHHKGLDEIVWQHLLKKATIKSPLYGSMILWRLIIMDRTDLALAKDGYEINQKMIALIEACPDDLSSLCKTVLDAAVKKIEASFVAILLPLLACSRRGLRQMDLEAITKQMNFDWNALDFARFTRYLSPYFIWLEDGRLDFSHKSVREGFLMYLGDSNYFHKHIIEHMKQLDEEDILRCQEGIWHCYQCDDFDFAGNLLAQGVHLGEGYSHLARALTELNRLDNNGWLLKLCQYDFEVSVFYDFAAFMGQAFLAQSGWEKDELTKNILINKRLVEEAEKKISGTKAKEKLLLGLLNQYVSALLMRSNEITASIPYQTSANSLLYDVYTSEPSSHHLVQYLSAQWQLAMQHYQKDDLSESYRVLKEALEIRENETKEKALDSYDTEEITRNLYALLSEICFELAYYEEGFEFTKMYMGAVISTAELLGINPEEDEKLLFSLAHSRSLLFKYFITDGNWQDALAQKWQECNERLKLYRRNPEYQNHFNYIRCYSEMGKFSALTEQWEDAMTYSKEAMKGYLQLNETVALIEDNLKETASILVNYYRALVEINDPVVLTEIKSILETLYIIFELPELENERMACANLISDLEVGRSSYM